jgi:putative phosphoribosyl transferase
MAIGAIASSGVRVVNEDIVRYLKIPDTLIDTVTEREIRELERREREYRGKRPAPELKDRTVILIDDGLATGASMRAAILGLRAHSPAQIVIAVPVAALETCEALRHEVDQIICASTPEPFYGVSRWYENFSQTTDEEVRLLLEEANQKLPNQHVQEVQ